MNTSDYEYSNENVKLIDAFLNDKGFQEMVERDIGKVSRAVIKWEDNTIYIYGEKETRALPIDATLAIIKGKVH